MKNRVIEKRNFRLLAKHLTVRCFDKSKKTLFTCQCRPFGPGTLLCKGVSVLEMRTPLKGKKSLYRRSVWGRERYGRFRTLSRFARKKGEGIARRKGNPAPCLRSEARSPIKHTAYSSASRVYELAPLALDSASLRLKSGTRLRRIYEYSLRNIVIFFWSLDRAT